MIQILTQEARCLTRVDFAPGWTPAADVVWIDLLNPTREEELACEAALGIPLPTREEMAEIEISSRLYKEDGGIFMTASLLAHSQGPTPQIGPVTFVLVGQRLVTIRYHEPRAFALFAAELQAHAKLCRTGLDAFLALLEAVIDRLADALEHAIADTDSLSTELLRQPEGINFKEVMLALGASQSLNSKVRESAASLTRLMTFAAVAEPLEADPKSRERLAAVRHDLVSLLDHSGYLAGNITFLLDAALGMINVEQNAIIKIFSVAAVVFLPPTLVASYFGMNFRVMPELSWTSGEPIAIGLMLLSVIVPLWWVRKKGWL